MLETVVCNGYWHGSTSQAYIDSSAQMPEGDVDDLLNLSRWHQMFSSVFVFQVLGSAREHFHCIVNVITAGENIWIFVQF